ncbi:stress response translation initiation inhibitor YciH [Halioxenophilus sp. WMMB6]|uniref:stress response translation initiation inhibitor YciH n=1 Tax=Halioxenophilus sp. WMMB6 TaxID=3073815 RepID=UPI00295E6116|nr:stress response translation initiation inhibitor YciH [Halioxenophilus sp. WMMB6]
MSSSNKNSRLVYSTDQGRIKEQAPAAVKSSVTDGIVRVSRETKGRKGKGVSLVTGIEPQKLKETAKVLKQKLGVGGAVKEGVIEIQSDDREKIKLTLETLGHQVKLAGG